MVASAKPPPTSDTEMEAIVRCYLESRDLFLSAARHVDSPGLRIVFDDVAVHRGYLAESTMDVIHDESWHLAVAPDAELSSLHWWPRVRHHFGEHSSEHALQQCAASERALAAILQDMIDSGKLTGTHQAILGEALVSVRQSLRALEDAATHLHVPSS